MGGSSNLGLPTTSSGRPIRSFSTLAELMKSQEEETKTALNIDRSVPTSSPSPSTSTGPVGSRGPPVMPYVSLADWLDQFFKIQGTSLEESLPKLFSETQQMLQNSVSSGSSVNEGSADGASKAGQVKEEGECSFSKSQEVATSTPKPKNVGESSASVTSSDIDKTIMEKANALLAAAKDRREEREKQRKSPLSFQILKATAPFVKKSATKTADVGTSRGKVSESSTDDQTDVPKSKRLQLSSAKLSDLSMTIPSISISSSETNLLDSGTKTPPDKEQKSHQDDQPDTETSEQAAESEADIGAKMLQVLVTNWPCIVATVLGFYPPCVTKVTDNRTTCTCTLEGPNAGDDSMECVSSEGSSTTLEFSSVHSIDSFITNLVLNCDDATIDTIVTTIVERMNSAVFKSADPMSQVDLSLLSEKVDFTKSPEEVCALNEHNTALLVGVRFMSSVVRLLALEHSRVKNAFVEMQQMRQSNAGMLYNTV